MKKRKTSHWIPVLAISLACAWPGAGSEPPSRADSQVNSPAPPSTSSSRVRLSPWANEVAKLAQAGVDPNVVFAFIEIAGTFNVGADEAIHLRNLGVPSEFIIAMVQHDADIFAGYRQITPGLPPPAEPLFPPSAPPAPANAAAVEKPQLPQPPQMPQAPQAPEASQAETPIESPRPVLGGLVAARSPVWIEEIPPIRESFAPVVAPSRATQGVHCTPAAWSGVYPVREPHPVPITTPVLVINAVGRTPNVQVIARFP
jgi:hypothetical protein